MRAHVADDFNDRVARARGAGKGAEAVLLWREQFPVSLLGIHSAAALEYCATSSFHVPHQEEPVEQRGHRLLHRRITKMRIPLIPATHSGNPATLRWPRV